MEIKTSFGLVRGTYDYICQRIPENIIILLYCPVIIIILTYEKISIRIVETPGKKSKGDF